MGHILECTGYDVMKTDFVKGEDCYLYDINGARYVDFEAGDWCTALGYNDKRINQVISTQIERIGHLGSRYTNDIVENAAIKVLDLVKIPEGKAVFLSSGSEAVEFGIQIGRCTTEKPRFIGLLDSFLSSYGSAERGNEEEWYFFDWSNCKTCPHSEECDPQCKYLKKIPEDTIGGFVFEPGNTSGLVKLPPKKLIQNIVRIIKKAHGIIIVDEVTTGFGRTGAWFGYEHYDLQPDIIAMGKGIGNGYPVSAVAMTDDIVKKVVKSGFHYAQSHQNDPFGCAIATEVITILKKDKLIERSEKLGKKFLSELECLQKKYRYIKEVRGIGLMLVIEFQENDEKFSLKKVYKELLNRGFVVGYKPNANLLRFYPALTIKEDDIKDMLKNLEDIISLY